MPIVGFTDNSPQIIYAESKATSVSFNWTHDDGGLQVSYVISYSFSLLECGTKSKKGENFPGILSLDTITVTSLKPNSLYVFHINATYLDGFVKSTHFNIKTKSSGNH